MYDLSLSIDVPALEPAAAFFEQAFGFTRLKEADDMVIIDAGNIQIYLLQKSDGTPAMSYLEARRNYGRHWTPIHLDVLVDDVDEALQRALDAGATLEGEIERGKWGAIAHCADPFGNGFCLIHEEKQTGSE